MSARAGAMAWLLAQPSVLAVITGVKRLDQLETPQGRGGDARFRRPCLASKKWSATPPIYPGWMQSYRASARTPEGYAFEGRSWGAVAWNLDGALAGTITLY